MTTAMLCRYGSCLVGIFLSSVQEVATRHVHPFSHNSSQNDHGVGRESYYVSVTLLEIKIKILIAAFILINNQDGIDRILLIPCFQLECEALGAS